MNSIQTKNRVLGRRISAVLAVTLSFAQYAGAQQQGGYPQSAGAPQGGPVFAPDNDFQQTGGADSPVRSSAYPQTGAAVFAPFVSDLRVEVENNKVSLFWTDSPSVKGPVYIYRSRDAGGAFNQPEITKVEYGTRKYTDTTPSYEKWSYLIVASDENGQRYNMIVPFRNFVELNIDRDAPPFTMGATALTAHQTTPQIYADAQSKTGQPNPNAFRAQALTNNPYSGIGDSLPYVEMAQSPIYGITALPRGQDVIIQFMTEKTEKNAVLYRSINPIFKFNDLLIASVVAYKVTSPYKDNVTPGVPYYYAVVFEEDLMNGTAVLSMSNNTTQFPVEVSRTAVAASGASLYPNAPGRYEPMPPQTGIPSAKPTTNKPAETRVVPDESRQALSIVRAPGATVAAGAVVPPMLGRLPLEMELFVFNTDKQKSREGTEEYELYMIIQRYLQWRNWNEGRGALMKFLTDRPRPAAIEARAHFYLGECAYFLGLYREALTEFVAIQSQFPDIAAAWVQATLARMSGK
ncbi:MAG: hypothetical protein LBG72_00970 [Spirochaetaceae bacterium]|jgi:TolA-binding protein|nr:hypothetical protein [Spirochaetaceae bacterium]